MRLTTEQRIAYMSCGGSRCPFCGSQHMISEISSYDRLQGVIEAHAQCTKCKSEWIDVFTLTNVLDVDGRE